MTGPWSAALRYGLMTFAAMLILAPITVMVAASFKPGAFAIVSDFSSWRALWVEEPTWANYERAVSGVVVPFLRVMLSTTIIVTAIVVAGVFVNSACAYGLARLGLPGKSVLLALVIALIILPLEAIAVPLLLLLVNRMGITDTYIVQIVPFVAHPFSTFLF